MTDEPSGPIDETEPIDATEGRGAPPLGFWLAVAGALVRRPRLWGTAMGQLGRLAGPGWWRRSPFLPLPDADYLRFRLETQYGSDRDPEPADVITYLHWCRSFRQLDAG